MLQEQSSTEASCGTRQGEDCKVPRFCLGASRATFAPLQPQERTLRFGWVHRLNQMESLSEIYKRLPPIEQTQTDMYDPSMKQRQVCKRATAIEQKPNVRVRR